MLHLSRKKHDRAHIGEACLPRILVTVETVREVDPAIVEVDPVQLEETIVLLRERAVITGAIVNREERFDPGRLLLEQSAGLE